MLIHTDLIRIYTGTTRGAKVTYIFVHMCNTKCNHEKQRRARTKRDKSIGIFRRQTTTKNCALTAVIQLVNSVYGLKTAVCRPAAFHSRPCVFDVFAVNLTGMIVYTPRHHLPELFAQPGVCRVSYCCIAFLVFWFLFLCFIHVFTLSPLNKQSNKQTVVVMQSWSWL